MAEILPDGPEQSAHTVYYAANRMAYRRFLAQWEQLFPNDSRRARRLWVTAREREPRAKKAARRAKHETVKAKRRAYYAKLKVRQALEWEERLRSAADIAKAMRERSKRRDLGA